MTSNEDMAVSRRTVAGEVARRGFTLIELLVVVAIIGILGTVAVYNLTKGLDTAHETAAQEGVRQIAGACQAYKMEHHKFPTSIDQLVEGEEPILDGGEGALYDPWGNKYVLEKKGKGVVIISAGSDSEIGTDDDIRSDKVKKPEKKN